MAGAKIALSSTSGELKTDGNDNARVNLPMDKDDAGHAVLATEQHDGTVGSSRLVRNLTATINKKLKVAQEVVYWDDYFQGTNQNLSKYSITTTTMTTAQAGGKITLNNSGITTTATGAVIRTYRTFPLFGNGTTICDAHVDFSLAIQSQNAFRLGFGTTLTAVNEPGDGIYFEIDSSGTIQLVANYNASKTTAAATGFSITAGRQYNVRIHVSTDRAELWIDDILYCAIDRSSSNTAGTVSICTSAHLFAQFVNLSTTAGGQKANISRWSVYVSDVSGYRDSGLTAAGKGEGLYSLPDGLAAGSAMSHANSAAPSSLTLSNTVAPFATTVIGGQFQFAAVAGAETDYIIFAYQVPAPAVGQPGKNLFVTGFNLSVWNMGAAIATTTTNVHATLAIGSTAASLATTDSATAGTRAPRRIPILGNTSGSVGTSIGSYITHVGAGFPSPLMVEAGTFLHLIIKMPVGTATASQIIRGTFAPTGYFE